MVVAFSSCLVLLQTLERSWVGSFWSPSPSSLVSACLRYKVNQVLSYLFLLNACSSPQTFSCSLGWLSFVCTLWTRWHTKKQCLWWQKGVRSPLMHAQIRINTNDMGINSTQLRCMLIFHILKMLLLLRMLFLHKSLSGCRSAWSSPWTVRDD